MVRPAIASSRVAVTDDGQVRITLKQAYRDGTAAIEIPPKDFVLRLLAQVPLPKRKMISYFGVFASNAKLRSAVVPAGTKPRFKRKKPRKVMHDALHGEAKPANTEELAEVMSEEAARRFSWADGLKRAFRLDLLTGSPASFEHFRKNPEIVGNPSRSAQTIQVAASPDLAPWCAG